MIIEDNTKKVKNRISNVYAGQVFRSDTGMLYLKMGTTGTDNAVSLESGKGQYFAGQTMVEVVSAKVVVE